MEVETANNSANDNFPSQNNAESPIIREEMVTTAVKFLQNPRVINTPLAQKQKFLQRKGLTFEEIQAACERSGAYQHHQQQQQQNMAPALPPPLSLSVPYNNSVYPQMPLTLFDRIREIVHNIAIFSIVAYFVHKFYVTYIQPFLFGKKKKSIEDRIQSLDKDIKKSVADLKQELSSVKVEVDKISSGSDSSLNRQLVDLKSDVATVKGLLLSRKQFPSVANSPVVPQSIPAWQMSSVQSSNENDENDHDRKEDLLEIGSGSGSEPEHCTKTSESSLEIIYNSRDCDSESCYSRKSKDEKEDKEDFEKE